MSPDIGFTSAPVLDPAPSRSSVGHRLRRPPASASTAAAIAAALAIAMSPVSALADEHEHHDEHADSKRKGHDHLFVSATFNLWELIQGIKSERLAVAGGFSVGYRKSFVGVFGGELALDCEFGRYVTDNTVKPLSYNSVGCHVVLGPSFEFHLNKNVSFEFGFGGGYGFSSVLPGDSNGFQWGPTVAFQHFPVFPVVSVGFGFPVSKSWSFTVGGEASLAYTVEGLAPPDSPKGIVPHGNFKIGIAFNL